MLIFTHTSGIPKISTNVPEIHQIWNVDQHTIREGVLNVKSLLLDVIPETDWCNCMTWVMLASKPGGVNREKSCWALTNLDILRKITTNIPQPHNNALNSDFLRCIIINQQIFEIVPCNECSLLDSHEEWLWLTGSETEQSFLRSLNQRQIIGKPRPLWCM